MSQSWRQREIKKTRNLMREFIQKKGLEGEYYIFCENKGMNKYEIRF